MNQPTKGQWRLAVNGDVPDAEPGDICQLNFRREVDGRRLPFDSADRRRICPGLPKKVRSGANGNARPNTMRRGGQMKSVDEKLRRIRDVSNTGGDRESATMRRKYENRIPKVIVDDAIGGSADGWKVNGAACVADDGAID